MKKVLFPLFSLLMVLSLHSCIVLSTQKYNALLAGRDSLAAGWNTSKVRVESLEETVSRLQADTAELHVRIAQLESSINGLSTNISTLRASSATEISKLAADLKKREARLKEVEDILRSRNEATNALRDKLQKALLGFKQSGLSVDIRNGKVYVSLTDKLLFASGSIVIDDKGKQALQELAKVLKTQPDINISVEGHTDDQKITNLGQIKDNWDLSVLRSTSVVRYLTEEQKIENTRITATGKGQYQPLDLAATPEARSLNRRIEIVLSPRLDELYNLIK